MQHKLYYHIVIGPQSETIDLSQEKSALKQIINQAAQVHGWKIHDLKVDPDHVYIFVQVYSVDLSADDIITIFKNESANGLVNDQGDKFWSKGYFVVTGDEKDVTEKRADKWYVDYLQ